MQSKVFIFDYDSTFISVESLEVLAHIVLENHPKKASILENIQAVTKEVMEGRLAFFEALKARLNQLSVTREHVQATLKELTKHITPSIRQNKQFFKTYADQIYIVSSGFIELIWPIVKDYGISKTHVFGNQFLFDFEDNIVGFDEKNILCQDNGKAELVRGLGLSGEIVVIGDGYNDYLIKAQGCADLFFRFTENIQRNFIADKADKSLASLDALIEQFNLNKTNERKKALLLENIDIAAVYHLEEKGFEVEQVKGALGETDLKQRLKGVSFLGIRSKTQVTRGVLEASDSLLAIGAFCIGTNQIDLEAASKQGIAVFNAPFSNTRSVVELVIGEIIMLYRGVVGKNNRLHSGYWQKSSQGAHEIRGKNLGIVGYGNIGSQLSVLAESLGMKVYYFDVCEKLPIGNAKKCLNLESLLKASDIVSLHVDGRESNEKLIDRTALSWMKSGSILLNLSRGKVVDLKALEEALKSGRLKGAALDVFPKEPKLSNDEIILDLQNMENVILTPHIGGSTEEAQFEIGCYVSERLTQYHEKGTSLGSVNFPELQLPDIQNAHRIIHIHKNIPGILAEINECFARSRVNIVGQYLKTNEDVGYVITDVESADKIAMIKKLSNIKDTIKVRILY